jgi:hypothetical protein
MRQFENFKMLVCLLIVATSFLGCRKESNSIESYKSEVFCEADFGKFFERFKKDSLYQTEHLTFPLTISYYETDNSDTLAVTEYVSKENFRKFLKLDFMDLKIADDSVETEVVKDRDTMIFRKIDYKKGVVNYKFVYATNCWSLVNIHDYSLQQKDLFNNSKILLY